VFIQHLDTVIANATWTLFITAVTSTMEGILYALLGMGVLLGLYYGLIKTPCSRLMARRRARSAPQIA
jgi:hypothetical protein